MASLAISGDLERGQDVRQQNVTAAMAIANIVKTSLGPMGLDKMLVDEVGDVTITNDGATILKQLEVEHPAAKVLVELSNLQDQEVGDGTTSVVILAAELLKKVNDLVRQNVHPTTIISGLNLAKKEACKYVAKNMAQKVADLGEDSILNAARTSISSKIIGGLESDFFATLAVNAVQAVKTERGKYPVHAITILKAHGRSAKESELVDGYALNCFKAAAGMPTVVKNAKIALLDIDLRKHRMALGVQVLVSDPTKLRAIRQREADITKERIEKLLAAGANVVLTTKGIDDQSLKYFVDKGVMGVRRVDKKDLRHIAKACGGRVLIDLAGHGDEDDDETVSADMLGEADVVEECKVGDGKLIYIRGCKSTRAQTVVLRGANDYMLDEVERSLHDAMMVVKRTLESRSVVPGGGAVEAALSVYMEHYADTMGTREQLAIAAFSDALLVIPKQLAVNAACDAIDLVAKLRAYHAASQADPENKGHYKWCGLDLETGKVRDNVKHGVLEPAISKIKSIKFAVEACVTLLRIDDKITLTQEAVPRGPHGDNY